MPLPQIDPVTDPNTGQPVNLDDFPQNVGAWLRILGVVLSMNGDRLGELTRTNSEAILGVRARGEEVEYSRGVAITSSLQVDEQKHVEQVR